MMALCAADPLTAQQARHLLSRTTLRFDQSDVRALIGREAGDYVRGQLAAGDDTEALERALSGLAHHGQSAQEIYRSLLDDSHATSVIEQEMERGRLIRGLLSRQQLREVMADFWFNHFNADPDKGAPVACNVERLEQDLRAHATDRFRVILGIAVKNPAVLENLDNTVSDGRAVNENFGRELMELYTVGPVYTQTEVVEMSRAFSGWSYDADPDSPTHLQFRYFPELQSPGPKTIFGHTFGDHCQEQVLDFLADHPYTAKFICRKLVVRFVADDPPEALVRRATERYLATHGDIQEVLVTILSSPEFLAGEGDKLKTPVEYLVAAVHAAGRDQEAIGSLVSDAALGRRLVALLDKLGSPYSCPNPLGWPDCASTWTSGTGLRARFEAAHVLAQGSLEARLASPEFQSR